MSAILSDPNIEILPLQFVVCVVMVAASLLLLLLSSCAGTTYEPCVSVTAPDGTEIKTCVRIEVPARGEEGKRGQGVEGKPEP